MQGATKPDKGDKFGQRKQQKTKFSIYQWNFLGGAKKFYADLIPHIILSWQVSKTKCVNC